MSYQLSPVGGVMKVNFIIYSFFFIIQNLKLYVKGNGCICSLLHSISPEGPILLLKVCIQSCFDAVKYSVDTHKNGHYVFFWFHSIIFPWTYLFLNLDIIVRIIKSGFQFPSSVNYIYILLIAQIDAELIDDFALLFVSSSDVLLNEVFEIDHGIYEVVQAE